MKRFLFSLVALGLLRGEVEQARAEYVFSTIDVPGSTFTQVTGINNLGQIVGNSSAGSFLLSGNNYTSLPFFAAGINDLGDIVGSNLIVHNDGSMTTLQVPPRSTGFGAWSINNLGQVVGSWSNIDHLIGGFLYSNGSYNYNLTALKYDPAFGINNRGQIVGQAFDPNTGPGYLLLPDGSYTTFGTFTTVPHGINESAQIVGYSYMYPDGMHHAFLMTDGVFTTFDVPGASMTEAYGINNAGDIVGTYVDANGVQHGFLAAPVPGPSSLLLLGVGTLGLIGWAWRPWKRVTATRCR
jgi:probable HAF family extracellular repeat protein